MSEQHIDIDKRLEEFRALCRARGLPLTIQRREVFRTVLERDDHPTADQVYDALADRIPGLSRTTVYRILGVLVDMGVVRRLYHPGAVARFDGKILRHHHLICRQCEKVIDIHDATWDRLALPETASEGFEIEDFSVYFAGVCAECRRKG